ncbi:hypothetical protein KW850_26010 [Bacillus sp. sid0103]|uniref:lipoprotein n=1 Tax=Bacillus sp. sid0103 TaxID=2856337 RepID=UPI001C43E07A|nr:lipoprotein [Bacillus sp. sid0103]MBV7508674.1 hypothetical protein [Bacillus sp. sid0103]
MRKSITLFIVILTILSGCQTIGQRSVIDWVDFIKWDDKMYEGIYTGIIADQKFIEKKLGEVKFKVADNVSDLEYKIKNGDAAFHEKGTNIYTIKGEPNLLAIKTAGAINGYNLYYARDEEKFHWQFQDMPLEKVNRIEIYQHNPEDGTKRMTELKNPDQVSKFLQILKNSKESPNFHPNTEKVDPDMFEMVLYTGDPVAYKFSFQFDGHSYFWYPSDMAILSNEIQAFIPSN